MYEVPFVGVKMIKDKMYKYSTRINDTDKLAKFACSYLEDEAQEVLLLACLDNRLNLIAVSEIGRGGMTKCIIDQKVVFRAALLSGCTSVILIHNHLSGDPTPSSFDVNSTKEAIACGRILAIPVLDHLIVSGDSWFSFFESMPELFKEESND